MSKHNKSSITKVIKQLKKCVEVTGIDRTAKGFMIYAKNGEKNLIHDASNCYHPLRRWLKQNTSLKDLTF